eukprot:TRINITY_DN3204_c0_g3_i1.p1 TRINITY_DN3204_c0_g3~~TRINITY_DN3204_c0_g3_i1.p1  ORF type:complete len:314 (-),score=77.07 TRINITY_DN3204_c0_g3_i1:559-1428(-)
MAGAETNPNPPPQQTPSQLNVDTSSLKDAKKKSQKQQNPQPHRPHFDVNSYLAGLCAGFVSTMMGYPIDALRVRLLFGTSPKNIMNGIVFNTIYSTLKSGLVWPLQKTLETAFNQRKTDQLQKKNSSSSSSSSAPTSASSSTVSSTSTSSPSENSISHHHLTSTVLAGIIGNSIPGLLCNPANVIKVRYMECEAKKTLSQIIRQMYHEDGLSVFKKGILATLLRDSTWGLLYFPIYAKMREITSKNSDSSTSSSPSVREKRRNRRHRTKKFSFVFGGRCLNRDPFFFLS